MQTCCLRGPHADLSVPVEAGRVVASGSRASSAVMRFQHGRPVGDVSGKDVAGAGSSAVEWQRLTGVRRYRLGQLVITNSACSTPPAGSWTRASSAHDVAGLASLTGRLGRHGPIAGSRSNAPRVCWSRPCRRRAIGCSACRRRCRPGPGSVTGWRRPSPTPSTRSCWPTRCATSIGIGGHWRCPRRCWPNCVR